MPPDSRHPAVSAEPGEGVDILARSVAECDVTTADRDRIARVAAAEAGREPAEIDQRVDSALDALADARQYMIAAVE